MNIEVFTGGAIGTNTYLVYDDERGYVIDPGSPDNSRLVSLIKEKSITIEAILLTHGHIDHIMGINDFNLSYGKVKVYIGEEEIKYLTDGDLNLSKWFMDEKYKIEVTKSRIVTIKDGDTIGPFTVIDTPGHTPGSKSFYIESEKILFSGDTIFDESYGRTDFAGGSIKAMIQSLKKLIQYPEVIRVYPGHGGVTTIGRFKKWFENLI